MSRRPISAGKAASASPDVAEKVRGIKEKQEKWLKQRQQSIDRQKGSKPPAGVTDASSKLRSRSASSIKSSTSPRNESNKSASTASRINPNLRKTYCKTAAVEKTIPNQDGPTSRDVLMPREQSPPSELQLPVTTPSMLDTNRSGADSVLSISESLRSGPISPEVFDDLADQIVNRVRKQLNLPPPGGGVDPIPGSRMMDRGQGDGGAGGSDCEDLGDQLNKSGYGLDSHRCHQCSKVMAPPDRSPMLVIPCGHTYCLQCTSNQSQCPGCQCSVQSLTCNIMLQQIIMEYLKRRDHNKQLHEQSSRERLGNTAGQSNKVYQPNKYKPEVLTDDEYHNLTMRCEVLEHEIDSIADNIRQVDGQVEKEEKQLRNISKEEERLEQEIRELERTLADLHKHKEDYFQKIQRLHAQKETEKHKQQMTRNTLRDLRKQIEMARKQFNGDV